jgi:hypothetical protein
MPFLSVMKENEDNLSQALAAKAVGALHLHYATSHLRLQVSQFYLSLFCLCGTFHQVAVDPRYAFVLISSIASLIGERTSAAYGAANGALDAIARHRTLMGLPALVVNFGQISK